MSAVRRACVRLGVVATISLFLSLAVMMFAVETRAVATWFIASAALVGLSFGVAVMVACFEL